MLLYGLFDRVDGTFNDSINMFQDDEAASIGLAKTFAYSNVMKEEYEMRCLGSIDEKTGSITPVVPYVVEMNEDVYNRARAVYEAHNPTVPKKVEANNETK